MAINALANRVKIEYREGRVFSCISRRSRSEISDASIRYLEGDFRWVETDVGLVVETKQLA